MAPFPLPLTELFGHWGSYVVYFIIGMGFGAVLEMAGFGHAPKLANQFYFKDFTVLKVMFGAIVVAMLLVFLTSGLGLLDYNLVWVNPTYLWPGIVGGLIMGAGFIIGGFCPGTSLVSAATLKIDGIMFVLGVFFGIFLFGETVGLYEEFWHSSYMGRFTIPELFNLNTGIIVLAITLMALAAFWVGEQMERIVGKQDLSQAPRWRYGAAGGVVVVAALVLVIGQPTTADRWQRIAEAQETALAERQIQIHPGELLANIHDNKVQVRVLDVRSEREFNQFHIVDSIHLPPEDIPTAIPDLIDVPANTLYVAVSNDEVAATEAWKTLVAESVPNVYILEGGINGWINTFADDEFKTQAQTNLDGTDDNLQFIFGMALGDRYPFADPNPDVFALNYESKVKLEAKRAPASGGCG